MEKRVGRKVGRDLQVDFGPWDVLEAKDRSTRLLEEEFITMELNQYGGCHITPGNKRHSLSGGLFCKQDHRVRVLQPHRQHPTTVEGAGGFVGIGVGRRVTYGLSRLK